MFENGFTIFRVRGIPVRLHLSLLLFLPYVAFVATNQFSFVARALGESYDLRLPPIVWGIALAIGLFVAVLIHELAHSLVAVKNGAKVRSITLMMLGGVSFIEGDLPPLREAWMAFAGPLASFGLAALSFLVYRFLPITGEVAVAAYVFSGTNALLGVFNLLPAFPMDGGRVVRGLLAPRLGVDRATRVATTLGKAMALAFVAYALYSFNLILLFIAFFVYSGASAEQARLSVKGALRGVPVMEVMTDRLGEAEADERVDEVARRLIRSDQAGAKVVDKHDPEHPRTLGVVTAEDLATRAAKGGAADAVQTSVRGDLRTVHPEDDAADTLDALAGGDGAAVVVVDAHDEVVGLLTADDLRRALALGSLSRR